MLKVKCFLCVLLFCFSSYAMARSDEKGGYKPKLVDVTNLFSSQCNVGKAKSFSHDYRSLSLSEGDVNNANIGETELRLDYVFTVHESSQKLETLQLKLTFMPSIAGDDDSFSLYSDEGAMNLSKDDFGFYGHEGILSLKRIYKNEYYGILTFHQPSDDVSNAFTFPLMCEFGQEPPTHFSLAYDAFLIKGKHEKKLKKSNE